MYCIQFDTSFIDGSLQLSSSFSSSVKIMNLSPAGCPQGSCISPPIRRKNGPSAWRGHSHMSERIRIMSFYTFGRSKQYERISENLSGPGPGFIGIVRSYRI